MSRRDKDLADALRRLEVPGHYPDFFASLVRSLDAIDAEGAAGRAAPGPPVSEVVPPPVATVEPITPVAPPSESAVEARAPAPAPPELPMSAPPAPVPLSPEPSAPASKRSVGTVAAVPTVVRKTAEPGEAPADADAAPPDMQTKPHASGDAVPPPPDADTRAARTTEQAGSSRPEGKARRSRRRPLALALAAVVVIAAVVVGILAFQDDAAFQDNGSPSGDPGGVAKDDPEIAKVKAAVTEALEDATSLRAVLFVTETDSPDGAPRVMRWNVAATTIGDFRLIGTNITADGVGRTDAIAYDATQGVERSFSREGNEEPFGEERTGLAAGAPDPSPSRFVLQRGLGSLARTLAAAEDPSVTEGTYEERPAWILETSVEPNMLAEGDGDHLQVTVDQATGFPVRVVETLAGELVREYRLEQLELNTTLPPSQFDLRFPEGMDVIASDFGFRRVPDAGTAAGYEPLEPSWLPDGFTLALMTVADEAQGTGKEGMNPESRSVVSSAYRRGFDQIVVSTRLVGDDPSAWSDPLASGEGFIDTPETISLEEGALAGLEAEIVVGPRTTPHLWTMSESLVVTVSGDLSREELIAVAESLAVSAR